MDIQFPIQNLQIEIKVSYSKLQIGSTNIPYFKIHSS